MFGSSNPGDRIKFQSLKGFQPKWNGARFISITVYGFLFQSLKGFQPKWNLGQVRQLASQSALNQFQSLKGFQPKWNPSSAQYSSPSNSFQSLKGFHPKWNTSIFTLIGLYRSFQSLKGFQPKWNRNLKLILQAGSRVSIPKRVSAKVELPLSLLVLKLLVSISFNP